MFIRVGEDSTRDRERRLYERAHPRVQAIKGFYVHAIAFVVVNALFALNALVGGAWWFYWPLIGWDCTPLACSASGAGDRGAGSGRSTRPKR